MSRKSDRRVKAKLPRDRLTEKQVAAYAKRSDGTAGRIAAAAKDLVDDGKWPSAERISGRTGIAVPTVRRHHAATREEKVRHVELHGPNRYWKDGEADPSTGGGGAAERVPEGAPADGPDPVADPVTAVADGGKPADAGGGSAADAADTVEASTAAGADAALLLLVERLRDELDRCRKSRAGLKENLAYAREQIVRLEAALDAASRR